MSDKPLSLRHETFVAEFLKDCNGTQAYIRAGYAPRGAQPSASRLLRDPRIAAAVTAGRQRISESLAVSVERVMEEYAKIAYVKVSDFVSTDEGWPPAHRPRQGQRGPARRDRRAMGPQP
jgi:phage terminase small subunit